MYNNYDNYFMVLNFLFNTNTTNSHTYYVSFVHLFYCNIVAAEWAKYMGSSSIDQLAVRQIMQITQAPPPLYEALQVLARIDQLRVGQIDRSGQGQGEVSDEHRTYNKTKAKKLKLGPPPLTPTYLPTQYNGTEQHWHSRRVKRQPRNMLLTCCSPTLYTGWVAPTYMYMYRYMYRYVAPTYRYAYTPTLTWNYIHCPSQFILLSANYKGCQLASPFDLEVGGA